MKTFLRKLSLFATLLLLPCLLHAESVQELFGEGQRAYVRGETEIARQKFKQVLDIDPRHQPSISYLRMIAAADKKSQPGGLEGQLRELVIPVEFRDATFSSALEFLRQRAAKANVQVSFVLQVPKEVAEQKVTLSLANAPVTEVLRYLGDLAGVRFRIEKYAVVVTPRKDVQ